MTTRWRKAGRRSRRGYPVAGRPMFVIPENFVHIRERLRLESIDYDGPLVTGEIGRIDEFRIIEGKA